MKAAWFVLGAVALLVSCSGEGDVPLDKTQQTLSFCRQPSFSGTVTSSGVTPGVWTGTAMTSEIPLEVTVSSNMPTGTVSAQPQHLLDVGYSRPDGTFRIDARCTYQGKYLTTGGYRSALVGCSPSNPGRVYAFNKATIQTSWSVVPPVGTTWTVTATPRELFDDDNACTTDTCTAAGATHAYNASAPGCALPSAPSGAGPVDPSLTSSVPDDAAKLFALQGGTPGALDPRRAAIARGYVFDTNVTTGAAQLASNVTVSILEHPEFGFATSRVDGTYELAVNGGGPMTLSYVKAGTLGAQRSVALRWHEFRKVQDVQLLSHNDAGSPRWSNQTSMQVARGRAENDARGSRQATILIPPGTTSSDVPSSAWTFHITEFTAGPDGPRRMPGALPDASGYTYAFAADITEANGAHVTFNKPLIFYVDNFPGFTVGKKAPLGWYDDGAAVWRGEKSGLVLHVIGIDNIPNPPQAKVDIDGNGGNDVGTPAFAALGITTAELEQLAALYPNPGPFGKKLIRVELPHLSKWDINWGIAPPAGASGPSGGPPDGGGPGCTSSIAGSIIECESRTLAEELPIVGTPFSLRYQSDRTKARRTPVRIPLTPAAFTGTVPKRVDWKVNVAGREFTGSVNNTPGQSMYFTWDGLDAFNRVVQGRAAMDIQVGNTYDGVYTDTSEFGYSGVGSAITGNPATGELTLWKADQLVVGAYDASGLGFGGWSLSGHHVLDAENGDIYLGSGKTRKFDRSYRMSWVGGDETLAEADGVSIKNTSLGTGPRGPTALAADPDGSIWFSQGGLNTHPSDDSGIRRVRPDGIVERITGIGAPPFSDPTDGMLASSARMYGAFVRVAPSGDLYVVDQLGNRIWRITNGTPRLVRLVAGDGNVCGGGGACGDGGLATLAQLNTPSSVAFDTAGNVYFSESNGGANGRVRRIDPQGRIATLFAVGSTVDAIEVDGLGKLLIHNLSGDIQEWPLASDGTTTLQTTVSFVAATGIPSYCSNPSMFLDRMKRVGFSCFNQLAIARDPNTAQRIAGVSPDLSYILGNQSYGDGRTALQASFSYVNHGLLAAAPDGSLLIIDNGNKIRRIGQQPLANNGTFQFPSEDGSELYEFGARGKHTRTLSALTGALRNQFNYDANGNLASIVDGNGLTTLVTRTSNQVQFQAPHGQLTTLTLNATTGMLTTLQNPGQTYSFTMSADGLHTQMTDSRLGGHTFDYDPAGYIDRDKDAQNYTQSLAQTYLSNGIKVEAKSAGGLSTFYTVTNETDMSRRVAVQRRVVTTPRNASYTDDLGADQVSVRTEANGTTVTRIATSDPRYGSHAPSMTSTTKTPLNVTHFVSEAVTAALATPSDPLSVQNETRTTSENPANCASGNTCMPLNQSTVVYDRATNTRTYTSAMGRTRVETLDPKDRVTQVAVPGVAPVAFTYDAEGNVYQTTQGTRTTTTTYVNGDLSTSQDSAGRITTYTSRDPMGRPLSISLPGSRTLAYVYDAAGNTTSITPPGAGNHAQGFDLRDLQTSFTVPNPNTGQTITTFNADRQATAVTFPFSFGLNLLTYTQGLYSGVSADTNVSRGFTRDAAERIASMTTGSIDGVGLGFTYDGHLQKSVTWSGNVVGAVNYEYDNHFFPYQLSVNATAAEVRTFDADNLLTGVTLSGATTTIGRDAQNGRITTVTTGNIVETRSYDATYGELSGLSYTGTSGNIYTVTYLRDALGRVTTKTETHDALPALTTIYSYDTAGRLSQENRGGVVTTWLYDGNGNRTHRNGVALGAADAQDRLPVYPATYDSVSYTYQNATGDVTSKGTSNFSWDRLGNLRSITRPFPASTVTYLYDAQDRRVAKKLGPTYSKKWLYDGQLRVVAELNSANAVQKRFVYGSRENVPDTMLSGGVTYRLVTDQLGSVVAVVNTSGPTAPSVESVTYDAWGNILSPASAVQPFRFAGGVYDADLALVHFGARDYDPSVGRWMSKDASRWGGGLNFYAYTNGDPVNFIDPGGRNAIAIAGIIVFAAALSVAAIYATYEIAKEVEKERERHKTKCDNAPSPPPGGCKLTGSSPGGPPECVYTCEDGFTFTRPGIDLGTTACPGVSDRKDAGRQVSPNE